jgi:mono/diheme cytochrome c family protein
MGNGSKRLRVMVGVCLVTITSGTAAWSADAGGKALFEKSCIGCHGPDGKGNEKMAKILGEKGLNITTKEVGKKSDDRLLKVLAEGEGKMPASKLSKEEQKQVLGYVRSLAK